MSNLYRCDGCGRPWRQVNAGPMLKDEVWCSIAGQQDILCNCCVRARIEQVLGRSMTFSDLLICPFNAFTGYLDELAPPDLIEPNRFAGK
jgi:hypothetical protein